MSVFWSWLGYPDIHIYADCWHLGGSGEKLAGSREIRLEPGVRLRGKSASPSLSPSLSQPSTLAPFSRHHWLSQLPPANRAASKSISRVHAFDPLPHQSIDVAILMLHLICSFSTSTQFPHPTPSPIQPLHPFHIFPPPDLTHYHLHQMNTLHCNSACITLFGVLAVSH